MIALFRSRMFQKLLLALTGLFLCLFLIVHLAGNLQLFRPEAEARQAFNAYAELLVGNPFVMVVSWGLYGCIGLHVILSAWTTWQGRRTGGHYAHDGRAASSAWHRRNMGLLGSIILIFLVLHFRDFWRPFRFGGTEMDPWGRRDLYALVQHAFAQRWYVVAYVLAMAALGLHLVHGVESAATTLGLHHRRAHKWVRALGRTFAVLVAIAFASIPVFMHFARSPQ